jgi:hypothetical protein
MQVLTILSDSTSQEGPCIMWLGYVIFHLSEKSNIFILLPLFSSSTLSVFVMAGLFHVESETVGILGSASFGW